MVAGFTLGAVLFHGLFNMAALSGAAVGITIALAVVSAPVMLALTAAVRYLSRPRRR
jgi:hypothetical protein